jgi:hypothetical protein
LGSFNYSACIRQTMQERSIRYIIYERATQKFGDFTIKCYLP